MYITSSSGEKKSGFYLQAIKNGARFVRGLAAEEQNFRIKVEDFDGNSTPDTDFGIIHHYLKKKLIRLHGD